MVVFWYAGPLSFYPQNIRLFLPHSREKDERNKHDIDVASPLMADSSDRSRKAVAAYLKTYYA